MLLAALMRASTFVAVGIHHRDLLSGGSDLSAGGNCRTVTNCSTTCEVIGKGPSGRDLSSFSNAQDHLDVPV